MKYIRTKDCIFELNNGLGQTPANVQLALIIANYKQANTIEKLCDCFLAVRKNASGTYSVFFIEFEDWKTWISGYVIYGAIYTDKGLIYVAKMNEKGDLELI